MTPQHYHPPPLQGLDRAACAHPWRFACAYAGVRVPALPLRSSLTRPPQRPPPRSSLPEARRRNDQESSDGDEEEEEGEDEDNGTGAGGGSGRGGAVVGSTGAGAGVTAARGGRLSCIDHLFYTPGALTLQ